MIDTDVTAPAGLPSGRVATPSAAADSLEHINALVPLPLPSLLPIEPSATAANIGNVSELADLPGPPRASLLPNLSSLIRMSPELALGSSRSPPPLLRSAATPPPQQVPQAESPQPRAWRRATATPESDAETNMDAATNRVLSEMPTSSSAPRVPIPMPSARSPMTPPPPAALPVLAPVAPTIPPASDLPDTSTWPKHVVDAYGYFTKETTTVDNKSVSHARNWGHGWTDCLEAFFEFQRRTDFPDSGPSFPPAAGVRPTEIGVWMKNRRPWKDMEIVDEVGFGQQWWDWWSSLQPGSRALNDVPTVDMDWGKLNKAGKNGFLLIMMSLVWWGKASRGDGGWLKAVTEVSTVLRCMQGSASVTPGVVVQPTRRNPLTSSNGANVVGSGSLKRRREGVTGDGPSTKKKKRVGR